MKRSLRSVGVLIAAMLTTGCGSTAVSGERGTPPRAGPNAPHVYVADFDVGETRLREDPGILSGRPRLLQRAPRDPEAELRRLSDLLADEIVADLRSGGATAERMAGVAARPATGWIVSGTFVEVDEGNRVRRAVLGFGAGDSKTRLAVNVADASLPPGGDMLDFDLASNGATSPGGGIAALATHTPYGMAAKFVLERDASDKDVKRAARDIADRLLTMAAVKRK